jgi:hypothetical protein
MLCREHILCRQNTFYVHGQTSQESGPTCRSMCTRMASKIAVFIRYTQWKEAFSEFVCEDGIRDHWHQFSKVSMCTPSEKRPFQNLCTSMVSKHVYKDGIKDRWHEFSKVIPLVYLLDTPSEKRPFQNFCTSMASKIAHRNSQKLFPQGIYYINLVKNRLLRMCAQA